MSRLGNIYSTASSSTSEYTVTLLLWCACNHAYIQSIGYSWYQLHACARSRKRFEFSLPLYPPRVRSIGHIYRVNNTLFRYTRYNLPSSWRRRHELLCTSSKNLSRLIIKCCCRYTCTSTPWQYLCNLCSSYHCLPVFPWSPLPFLASRLAGKSVGFAWIVIRMASITSSR